MKLVSVAASTGPDLSILGQYGVLGLFCLLLIIFARTAYKRETDRSDAYATQLAELNKQVYETLVKAATALEGSARTVQQLSDTIRDQNRDDRGRR